MQRRQLQRASRFESELLEIRRSKPETATTYSVGFDVDPPPAKWLHASVSYFQVTYNNRIENPILIQPPNSATYPEFVILNPTAAQADFYQHLPGGDGVQNFTGQPYNPAAQTLLQAFPNLAIVDDRSINVATEKVKGLDFAIHAKQETRFGVLSAGFDGTYTIKHTTQDTPQSAILSVVDLVGLPASFRFRTNTGWTDGPVSVFVFVNHVSGYTNQFSTPKSTMGSLDDRRCDFGDRWIQAGGPEVFRDGGCS